MIFDFLSLTYALLPLLKVILYKDLFLISEALVLNNKCRGQLRRLASHYGISGWLEAIKKLLPYDRRSFKGQR